MWVCVSVCVCACVCVYGFVDFSEFSLFGRSLAQNLSFYPVQLKQLVHLEAIQIEMKRRHGIEDDNTQKAKKAEKVR